MSIGKSDLRKCRYPVRHCKRHTVLLCGICRRVPSDQILSDQILSEKTVSALRKLQFFPTKKYWKRLTNLGKRNVIGSNIKRANPTIGLFGISVACSHLFFCWVSATALHKYNNQSTHRIYPRNMLKHIQKKTMDKPRLHLRVPEIPSAHQIRLSISSDTNNYFDQTIFPTFNQPFQIYIPFNSLHSFLLTSDFW